MSNLFPKHIKMDKPIIFAIVGPSGSGKSTAAAYLSRKFDIPVLSSYTTRPRRVGEKDGVDHIFVTDNDLPNRHDMIAYTFFGGHHYWATRNQVDGKDAILYVIDEIGLSELIGRFEKIYYIVPIYIMSDKNYSGDEKRGARDLTRHKLNNSSYRTFIANNGSIPDFLDKCEAAIFAMIDDPVRNIGDWCRLQAGLPIFSDLK